MTELNTTIHKCAMHLLIYALAIQWWREGSS